MREEIDIAAPEYLCVNRTTSLRECEAILAQIIEIKVSQSESMLILELVRGSQTIRCLGFRAVRCRVNRMYSGEAEALYLYNT